jgi:hypothetical protein
VRSPPEVRDAAAGRGLVGARAGLRRGRVGLTPPHQFRHARRRRPGTKLVPSTKHYAQICRTTDRRSRWPGSLSIAASGSTLSIGSAAAVLHHRYLVIGTTGTPSVLRPKVLAEHLSDGLSDP